MAVRTTQSWPVVVRVHPGLLIKILIMTNPFNAYKRWRNERRDARLRLLSLSLAHGCGGRLYDILSHTHVFYLYLKYGFNKDGVEVGEIFKRVDEEIPGFKVPEKPLKP